MDLGVTYIPWEKVKVDDLDGFAEGGMIDQETVNAGENANAFYYLKVYFRRLLCKCVWGCRVNCAYSLASAANKELMPFLMLLFHCFTYH